MRRIVGSVLAATRPKFGIANLLVVGYHLSERGLSLRDLRPTDGHLEALGTRLGSATTDSRGAFEIPLDQFDIEDQRAERDVARDGHSLRFVPLNLVTAVFSPDDPSALAETDRRALSRSAVRPGVTSEQEAFILVVEEDSVPMRATPDVDLASQVEGAYTKNAALKERLGPRQREVRKAALQRLADARENLKDFSAVPRELRKSSNYIAYGKRDLAKNGTTMQREALVAGCRRFQELSDAADRRGVDGSKKMRLVLGNEQVKALGLKIDDEGLIGQVTPGALSAVLHSAIGGASLTRTHRIDLDQLAMLQTRYGSWQPPADDSREPEPASAVQKTAPAAKTPANAPRKPRPGLATKKSTPSAAPAGDAVARASNKTSAS